MQSGYSSHLQDWRSMHLETMEAQTASLQPETWLVMRITMVTTHPATNIVTPPHIVTGVF